VLVFSESPARLWKKELCLDFGRAKKALIPLLEPTLVLASDKVESLPLEESGDEFTSVDGLSTEACGEKSFGDKAS